ncbi:MAG: Crp/Fnr family transcriptional regulator [Pseudomonadota bacterium]
MVQLACNPSVLRTFGLFSSLTNSQFGSVLQAMQHRSFDANVRILTAGDRADALYVVVSGRVRVIFEDGDGHELIAATIGLGEFFGEVGLVEGKPHSASVETQEATEVLVIPRKILLECVEHNAHAAMSLLRTVMQRLDEAHNKMAMLALMDVYGRVGRVLLDTCHDVEGQLLVEEGTEEIAAMVGASREMVSRVLKEMIAKGVVRRTKRKLIVLDRSQLAPRSASVAPAPGWH